MPLHIANKATTSYYFRGQSHLNVVSKNEGTPRLCISVDDKPEVVSDKGIGDAMTTEYI